VGQINSLRAPPLAPWCPPASFKHDLEQLEVTCVLFARDDKRGSDSVYAAGWNQKVRAAYVPAAPFAALP
jgi:hypothetical protein